MIDNIYIYHASNKSGDVLFSSKNKKVIGKFKDELGWKVMSEFIVLRSKSYAFTYIDNNNIEKCDKKLKGNKEKYNQGNNKL